MRLLSAGIFHETNTFAATPTTLEDYIRDSGGDRDFPASLIRKRFEGTATIHGGYLHAAKNLQIDLTPVFLAQATPSGTVQQACYEHLKENLSSRIRESLPADGILLDMHGAMVTEQLEDAEGDIAQAVRELVGPDVPIIMTLDLHANITQQMADHCTAIIGFDTYPHCDMFDRGVEAVELMHRTVAGQVRPVMAYLQLPLITMPPMQCTLREPMATLVDKLHQLEAKPGVLTATLSCGFPFADIKDAGTSILVVTDGDKELAKRLASEFGKEVFDRRDDFTPKLTTPEQAIEFARANPDKGPVILADGSDNPGGGAPCDGTVILKALIDHQMTDAVVGVLYDPETVAQAHQAGVGATIDAAIGGKTDDRHGETIHTKAYVRLLGDGRFTYQGPMGRGFRAELGRMAVLEVGGVEVVLAERRQQLRDMEMLRCVGIEPSRRRFIAVKSAVHFRAHFQEISQHIFDADTPGVHRPDFSMYEFRNLRRPIYPLDNVTM